MSTGKPKTTDHLISTVYLRHENNKVSDIIKVETKDHVKAEVKVSYCVNFDPEAADKWFCIDNYVKYLCDHERALIKRAAKNYTIEEFYQDYADIVHSVATGGEEGVLKFSENGMYVSDCEVLSLAVQDDIARLLTSHQYDMVQKALDLSDAERRVELVTALATAEQAEQELKSQQLLNKMALQRTEALKKQEIQAEVNRKREAEDQAAKQAELDMQVIVNAIADADNARRNAAHTAEMERQAAENAKAEEHARQMAEIEKTKNESYAATVAKIMESIAPDLVAALGAQSNADIVSALSRAVGPYSIAQGDESIADVTSKLLRGTGFEDIVKHFGNQ